MGLAPGFDLRPQPNHVPPRIRIHRQGVDDVGPVVVSFVAVSGVAERWTASRSAWSRIRRRRRAGGGTRASISETEGRSASPVKVLAARPIPQVSGNVSVAVGNPDADGTPLCTGNDHAVLVD